MYKKINKRNTTKIPKKRSMRREEEEREVDWDEAEERRRRRRRGMKIYKQLSVSESENSTSDGC